MRHFYQKLLPANGVYCAAGIEKGRIQNVFAESLEELFGKTDRFRGTSVNVFVAPGSFKNHSRRAENSLSVKSFFIDLDVGEGKGYSNQQDALQDLERFIAETELPPPVRVNSGNGIHAYWIFETEVPTAEWRPYAKKFKEFCFAHGLKIDPVVTADAARIMRCPDTLNYKTDPPLPTALIDTEIHEYSFEAFRDFLGEVEPDVETILALAERGLDEDTKAFRKYDSYETLFSDIVLKSLADDGCGQIKHIIVNAATLSEPEWYAGLSIARQCDDWETAIHAMSEDHPGYDHEQTVRKAEQTAPSLSNPDGLPRSCTAFANDWPERCEGCAYKGKIKNPLPIGRRVKQGPVIAETPPVEEAFDVSEPVAAAYAKLHVQHGTHNGPLPEELWPFSRSAKGEIFYTPPPETTKDGKTAQSVPIRLTDWNLYPVKRMFNPSDGECLLMRFELPHDPDREFVLPASHIKMTERFKETVGKFAPYLFTTQAQTQLLMEYVAMWGKYLLGSNAAEQMRMQMGWTEDRTGFVIGESEIKEDGTIVQTAASSGVRNISKLLRPVGSYKIWKSCAAALNEEGFEVLAFGLLTGFGSPLMSLTSTSGVNICLTGDSGFGKSGALYGALSIWGQPKDLSIVDATENGLIGRYLGLKNIVFGLDEVSNRSPEELSNLIHRVSQGKGKIRMQASTNSERDLQMSASLINFMTSNQSIYDKLRKLKEHPDGEVARVIEFAIQKPAALDADGEMGKRIFDPYRTNYGHAGVEFIQHHFKRGDKYVKALIDKWVRRFTDDFGSDSAYRFYENLIGCTFAGGELAMEAGIIDYDLERIYKAVVLAVIAIRDESIQVNKHDYPELLSRFVETNQDKILIMDGDRVTYDPRMAVWMRSDIRGEILYVSAKELRGYLSSIGVSSTGFMKAMEQLGALRFKGKKRLTSGWRAGISLSPVSVLGFRYEINEEVLKERLAARKREEDGSAV